MERNGREVPFHCNPFHRNRVLMLSLFLSTALSSFLFEIYFVVCECVCVCLRVYPSSNKKNKVVV